MGSRKRNPVARLLWWLLTRGTLLILIALGYRAIEAQATTWYKDDQATTAQAMFNPPLEPVVDIELRDLPSLDTAFLIACGEWGGSISHGEAELLIGSWVREQWPNKTSASLEPTRDQAVQVWTEADAISHVFCGSPSQTHLGGMHWGPRFQQMQGDHIGLDDVNCRATSKYPVIKTGLVFKTNTGELGAKCPASVVQDLPASHLLTAGLRGWLDADDDERCRVQSTWRGMPLEFRVVKRDGSLRSVWPVTPSASAPKCGDSILVR